MAHKKGAPKVGGRKKGTSNKVTISARELFVSTLEGEVPNIQDAFEKVKNDDPAMYLNLLAKYAQYFVPKMVDITTRGESTNTIPITSWIEDDKS